MPTKNQKKIACYKIASETPLISDLEAGAISGDTLEFIRNINQMGNYNYKINSARDLLSLLPSLPQEGHCRVFRLFQERNRQKLAQKKGDKKQFVKNLKLKSTALPAAQMGIPIETRERDCVPSVKSQMILVDPGNKGLVPARDMDKMRIVGAGASWRFIKPGESIIFQNSCGGIELAVIRSVSGDSELLKSMNKVIKTATTFRRGVRPNHRGRMVQLGYNAGPRHCRVFGLVNNFKSAKLALETKSKQDEQAVGALSFFWHLIRSHAPKETVDCVEAAIEKSGMPEMDSRFGKEQAGYSITIGEQEFVFPTVCKAPCEGYFATDYAAPTHSDAAFADYGFAWSTMHTVAHQLRSKANSGGNFVDVSLRVIVQSAADTLLIFRPKYRHGTTLARPTTTRAGMVVAFSMHIKKAYDIALANAAKGRSAKLIPSKKTKKIR